jgi:hypothetical protein
MSSKNTLACDSDSKKPQTSDIRYWADAEDDMQKLNTRGWRTLQVSNYVENEVHPPPTPLRLRGE